MRMKSGSPEKCAGDDIRRGAPGKQCRTRAKSYCLSTDPNERAYLGRWLQSYNSYLRRKGYESAAILTPQGAKIDPTLRQARHPAPHTVKVVSRPIEQPLPRGLFSVTPRSRGQYGERWYCRVSVPLAVADAAGWRSGMTVAVTRKRDRLRFTIDDDAKLSIPEAKGRREKTRSLEFAVGNLGLGLGAAQEIDIRFDGKAVIAVIPIPCRKPVGEKGGIRIVPEKSDDDPIVLPYALGTTERAITMDGLRYGKDIEPVTVPDVIRILTECGRRVQPQGPRLFKLDGETVMLPDVFDAARAAVGKDLRTSAPSWICPRSMQRGRTGSSVCPTTI